MAAKTGTAIAKDFAKTGLAGPNHLWSLHIPGQEIIMATHLVWSVK